MKSTELSKVSFQKLEDAEKKDVSFMGKQLQYGEAADLPKLISKEGTIQKANGKIGKIFLT